MYQLTFVTCWKGDDCLTCTTGEWTEVDQLIQPASSVSATAHGDQIFVYGGEKSDRTDSCVVQCYHTVSRAVSVVASLPVNCKLSRAVVCDQNSYLVLFDGQVGTHFVPSRVG